MGQDKTKIIDDEVKLVETPDAQAADDGEAKLRVGATIDEFVIESLLGRGGVSEVYQAKDTRTDSEVAIKFLLPARLNDKQSCERLRNEAKSIMALRHRHVVSVFDVRENSEAGPYVVMELIHGKTLGESLPLPEPEALEMCAQVAEALSYAHSKGMVHRDIKPSNVMRRSEDNSVQLVDFGLAKVFSQEEAKHIPLTRTSEVVGTPLYMSPEQCFGHTVDARTDIYQLGCLLYQCITGCPPFEGNTSFEAMFKHVSAQPELHSLSPAVKEIVLKALEKNPEDRFQTASEMAAAMRDAAKGKTTVKRRKRVSKRSKIYVGIAAGLIAGSLCLLSIMPLFMHPHSGGGPVTAQQMLAQRFYDAGVDYKAKGWTEKSRESLQQAIDLDRGAIGFKALSFLRSHLPAHPQSTEAEQANIYAYNLAYQGKYDQAEQVWKDCILKYPDFEWPYSNLGAQYVDQGQIDKAVPLLEKAIEINPYYTNALRHLAAAEQRLGKQDAAAKLLQRAEQSDPGG